MLQQSSLLSAEFIVSRRGEFFLIEINGSGSGKGLIDDRFADRFAESLAGECNGGAITLVVPPFVMAAATGESSKAYRINTEFDALVSDVESLATACKAHFDLVKIVDDTGSVQIAGESGRDSDSTVLWLSSKQPAGIRCSHVPWDCYVRHVVNDKLRF